MASKLTEARRRAAAKLGRVPSADEWAAECGRELVGEALATGASQSEAAPEGLAAALVFSPSPPGALGLWGALGRGRRAKQLLVEANLRLVVKIAGGLSSRRKGGPTLPDAIQEGTLGLVRAAEKFDPELGLRFSTYAFRWITTFVQRAGATDRLIRLPDNVRADLERLFAASVKLGEVLGREPTDLELARELPSGITPEKYRHLRTTHRQTGAVLSLNFMKGGAKQRARMNEGYSLADRVPDDASGAPEARLEAELEAAEMRSHVEWLMEGANLDPKLRKVVELRFGLGGAGGGGSAVREMPHTKVGLELGISRERARQLNKRALQKIKASAGISECPV